MTHTTSLVPPTKEGSESAMFLDSLKCAWLSYGLIEHELFEMLTPEIKQSARSIGEVSSYHHSPVPTEAEPQLPIEDIGAHSCVLPRSVNMSPPRPNYGYWDV